MKVFRGKGLCGTVADGVLYYWNKANKLETAVQLRKVDNPGEEVQRFCGALDRVEMEYRELYQQCFISLGEQEAELFRAREMMIKDEVFVSAVCEMIVTESVNAEYAVWRVESSLAEELEKVQDSYISLRSLDIRQIRDKVINMLVKGNADGGNDKSCMTAQKPYIPVLDHPEANALYILAVDDLTPEEFIRLPKERLQGFILKNGNQQSHTAILIKALGIPTVIQLEGELDVGCHGKVVILDGDDGAVYLEPDEETETKMKEKQRTAALETEELHALIGLENITGDGKRIDIYANVASLEEVNVAFAKDAGGIGLLRSEFLYREQCTPPDEEVQLALYREILQLAGEKEVIIRTFDFGADKVPDYLHLDKEENPALGLRGIRLGFQFPQLLKTQLRALFRAGVRGNLSIMYPMICTLEEVKLVKEIEQQVKKELKQEGKAYREDMPVGIMIETPSAALLSKELAESVDFFSVGTNDLTQYTYARDRQQVLEKCGSKEEEAVLRLIEMSARNAHNAGIRIGICGEMASDETLIKRFMDMGIDEISVSVGKILHMRNAVRKL